MGRKVIKINEHTAIVVEPFQNDYGNYVGVREFYKPKDDLEGDWRPTQRGLSIPVPSETGAKDIPAKVRKAISWAVENFEEEHKVLESTKGPKAKKEEEPKKKSKDKDKDKKKAKKRRDTEDDDE